jgi:hypothetical protein
LATVFGVHLVAFRLRVMVAAEVVLLSVGPVLLASLGYYRFQQTAISAAAVPSHIRWRPNLRGYGRFWLAFILGAIAQVGLVVSFLKLNPNVRNTAFFSIDAALILL